MGLGGKASMLGGMRNPAGMNTTDCLLNMHDARCKDKFDAHARRESRIIH